MLIYLSKLKLLVSRQRAVFCAAILMVLLLMPRNLLAEAPVITSAGLLTRTISYTLTSVGVGAGGGEQAKVKTETLSSPAICERISTPSSLGLEIGTGGCAQLGGTYTFTTTVSGHVMLLYYPLASRFRSEDDSALQIRFLSFSNLYIILMGGFSKITHQQVLETNLTLSTDTLDFGGGIGYSYRVFDYAALGFEGYYLAGSVMSKAATGSTNAIYMGGTLTFFL